MTIAMEQGMINLLCKEYDDSIHFPVRKTLVDSGWRVIGSGSFRMGFLRKKTVIKVPLNYDGFQHNVVEAYAYRKYRNEPSSFGIVYAPCRLLPNGCLMMPKVERVNYSTLPSWAQYIDAAQAGEYKGRIVGYDTGCDSGDLFAEALRWAKLTD